MRDMIAGGAILTWVFIAAHAGTSQVSGLFALVQASLAQFLGQIG